MGIGAWRREHGDGSGGTILWGWECGDGSLRRVETRAWGRGHEEGSSFWYSVFRQFWIFLIKWFHVSHWHGSMGMGEFLYSVSHVLFEKKSVGAIITFEFHFYMIVGTSAWGQQCEDDSVGLWAIFWYYVFRQFWTFLSNDFISHIGMVLNIGNSVDSHN